MHNLRNQCLLILFCACLCSPIGLNDFPTLIVWNIGQGSWSTLRETGTCTHFDAGGEKAPFRKILGFCEGRKNIMALSHDDFDHVRYISWLASKLNACWWISPSSKKFFRRLKFIPPTCRDFFLTADLIYAPPALNQVTNMQSLVYVKNGVLFPGDAPSASEKKWSHDARLRRIRILLLGHHGSKGSTSEELLDKLVGLKIAIASARRSRYGHPHPETLWRLRKFHRPVLTTEDWGTIEVRL